MKNKNPPVVTDDACAVFLRRAVCRAALTGCSRCANIKGGQDFGAAKAKADFNKNHDTGIRYNIVLNV